MGSKARKCAFAFFKIFFKAGLVIAVIWTLLVGMWMVVPDDAPSPDAIAAALHAGRPVTRMFSIDGAIAPRELPSKFNWGVFAYTTPTHFVVDVAFIPDPATLVINGHMVPLDGEHGTRSSLFSIDVRVGDLDNESSIAKFKGADALLFMWWATGRSLASMPFKVQSNASSGNVELWRGQVSPKVQVEGPTPLVTIALAGSATARITFARESTSPSNLYGARLLLFAALFALTVAVAWFFTIGLSEIPKFILHILDFLLWQLFCPLFVLAVNVLGTLSLIVLVWWRIKARHRPEIRHAFKELIDAIRKCNAREMATTQKNNRLLVDLETNLDPSGSEQVAATSHAEETLITV